MKNNKLYGMNFIGYKSKMVWDNKNDFGPIFEHMMVLYVQKSFAQFNNCS
jgi:hypothetical protein